MEASITYRFTRLYIQRADTKPKAKTFTQKPFHGHLSLASCVIMCLFRSGQLHKRRTHSQSHSLVCATALCPRKRRQLAHWSPIRNPFRCGLGAKAVHVWRFAAAARAHGQSNGLACPSDAQASGGEPSGEFSLPRSSSTESGAKGAVPRQWKSLRPAVPLPPQCLSLLQWHQVKSLFVHLQLHHLHQTHSALRLKALSCNPLRAHLSDVAQTCPLTLTLNKLSLAFWATPCTLTISTLKNQSLSLGLKANPGDPIT